MICLFRRPCERTAGWKARPPAVRTFPVEYVIVYAKNVDEEETMRNLGRRDFLTGTLASWVALPVLAHARAAAAANAITITAVEPYVLKGGKCFVLVRTSENITGIGEVSPMNAKTAATLIETSFAKLLIGMNPLDVDRCWEKVFYATYKQGPMGLQPEALAGVDIALWDILGKVSGLPICQLIGGKRRDKVRMYCSIGGGANSTVEEMVKRAGKAMDEGFTAVKIRQDYGPAEPDRNVEKDLKMLREVRKVIGDKTDLKYDVNNGYSVQTAINVGKAIADINVIHYEEPVAQSDYAGYAKVVDAVDVPVAAGEHEYTRWQFRDLIEQANPDIVQPDLVKCGGISEAVKIAALASARYKLLCPHQTQATIGTAANLHFTSVFVTNDMAQEYAENNTKSELHSLFKEPLEFKNGHLTVPTGPGLGLELDEQRLTQFLA
jgi:L-alanine-DL-glutamate epimerase-like enolase superfamily enzyme